MSKHIRLITVHTTPRPEKLEGLKFLVNERLKISQVKLDSGPPSVESEFDEVLSAPFIAGRAMEAIGDGADALVIDCMGDPGLHATREIVRIPVLGPGEVSMHMAAMLGHKFSVVTIMDRLRPVLENRAKIYGVYDRLASVRAVEVPVLEINTSREKLYGLLAAESLKAVEEDKADVIVLGCTGFFGCDKVIAKALRHSGYDIPVIDPLPATVAMAAGMLDVGLTHSLSTYPLPPVKKHTGYKIPQITKTATS